MSNESLRSIVDLEQGSEAWHLWRRSGIGGSDAPAVRGESPYKTKRELYFEKCGTSLAEEDDSQEFIFALGHKTEQKIRKEFQELVRAEIKTVCMQRTDFPELRASLDGFSPSLGVLEGKLVGESVLKTALEQAEIPRHHWIQMQHQMAVSGADVGRWFGHNGKDHGALIEVTADKEFIAELTDMELKFWDDIQNKRVPALSERDWLTPDDLTYLERLREAKELADNAKLAYEILRDQVGMKYGHNKIRGAGVSMNWIRKKGNVDIKSIPAVQKAIDALTEDEMEQFRGAASEFWKVDIEKPKKAKVKNGE